MEIYEAKFISNYDRLSKTIIKWEIPADLRRRNKGEEYKHRTLIGIGKWQNKPYKTYVCISQGDELIYIEKPLWLEIAKELKNKQ